MKIDVRDLGKVYSTRAGEVVALDGTSFTVAENEFVTLVGTSGCGKSTALGVLAGLQEASSGVALVDGQPVGGPGRDRGVVFQTYTLFPWMSARKNVEFALRKEAMSSEERRARADEYLNLVGLSGFADALPNQLSGGMRQRVAIAAALIPRPKLLFADEPTTALDVTVQAEIIGLLGDLCHELGMAMLLVTHDLGVVAGLADRIAVMYAGRIVEYEEAASFLAGPAHPYSAGLLAAVPSLDDAPGAELRTIAGTPPRPGTVLPGCRFEPRCDRREARCRGEDPPFVMQGSGGVACHFPLKRVER